jgi:hypothetical protein
MERRRARGFEASNERHEQLLSMQTGRALTLCRDGGPVVIIKSESKTIGSGKGMHCNVAADLPSPSFADILNVIEGTRINAPRKAVQNNNRRSSQD